MSNEKELFLAAAILAWLPRVFEATVEILYKDPGVVSSL